MRWKVAVGLLAIVLPSAAQNKDHNFNVAKNLDVFNAIYKQLDMMYVDTLNADEVIGNGINAMLRSLDPYTVYFPAEQQKDLKEIYTGKFAGIGALIRYYPKLKHTIIDEPYRGMPAAEAGLRKGDIILSIDDKVNTDEARITASLLQRIHRFYGPRFDAQRTVGVIVPYRNQIAMIRREIEKLGIDELLSISIDTVERYQGSQRDVIIYSFTVQNRYQLDFLTSNCFEEDGRLIDRKLNVALTRARLQMILTGHPETLSHNRIFRQLINDVKSKGGYHFL